MDSSGRFVECYRSMTHGKVTVDVLKAFLGTQQELHHVGKIYTGTGHCVAGH